MEAAGVPQMNSGRTARTTSTSPHEADTLDKVDPHELAMNAAALAVMAYGIADLEGTLPRLDPEQRKDR